MKGYDKWLDKNNPYTNDVGMSKIEIEELQRSLSLDVEWLFGKGFTGNDLLEEVESLKSRYESEGLEEEHINDVLREYDLW